MKNTMTAGEMEAFRVLKAYGSWEVGDIHVGKTVAMAQGVRTGMVERAPEHDHELTFELASPAEQEIGTYIKNAKATPKAKKKADDGEAAI